ncbi:MAG: S41 family peptidase [Pseudomonadota bacterium]
MTLALALVACGGGGGSGSNAVAGGSTPSPSPAPPPTSSACSLSAQQDFADDVLNEWYLFPSLLDNSVNPANFTSLQSYLDARVAPARAQSRDRGFTFATSIQEENELINSGSSAGFGIRLSYDTVNDRVFVLEAYENAPGLNAGIDRGTELLGIGTTSANLQTVSSLMGSGGPQAVVNALGPSTAGTARVIRFAQVDGTVVEISITKTNFALDPISNRYGALILNDGGKSVGYLNLRTFIVSDAANQLREAFQLFGSQGVTELILDLRYNGGGLVSVADTMGDLMGQGRVGQVWSETVLRASKSSENSTELFESEVNAIQPTRIAVIGTRSTASASELVTNSMIPYVGSGMALVGSDTSGKPVGQFGFDLDECDLRIRAVTFQTINADGNGDYFTGLASVMPNTCRANDDISIPFGDPREASIATALDFLAGRSCSAISGGAGQTAQTAGGREALQPERPNAAQYELPGLF